MCWMKLMIMKWTHQKHFYLKNEIEREMWTIVYFHLEFNSKRVGIKVVCSQSTTHRSSEPISRTSTSICHQFWFSNCRSLKVKFTKISQQNNTQKWILNSFKMNFFSFPKFDLKFHRKNSTHVFSLTKHDWNFILNYLRKFEHQQKNHHNKSRNISLHLKPFPTENIVWPETQIKLKIIK